jgi:hypothetical protein
MEARTLLELEEACVGPGLEGRTLLELEEGESG